MIITDFLNPTHESLLDRIVDVLSGMLMFYIGRWSTKWKWWPK